MASSAVEGPDGVAGPPSRPPVVTGGVDGSGNIRRFLTDTAGALKIAAGVTLTAENIEIGTVDQGTAGASPWLVSINNVPHVIVDSASLGTVAVSIASLPALAAGTAVIGHVIVDSAPSTAVTNTGTFAVQAASTLAAETTKVIGTVNIASGQTVNPTFPATGTVTSPASVTTSVATVLASNTGRYGATVYNESGAACYLKLGTAASLTSYTVQVAIGGYYEVPYNFTGALTGITSAGTAVLRVTEMTA